MKEVTIIGKTGLDSKNESKPLSSVDEYIERQGKINLIKRGAYALEPAINNMTTERTSVTIDGMKIFCACTDKMDPVTSYVEIVNLAKINIASGFEGTPHASNNIGGSIDMKLYKAGFGEKSLKINTYASYETNGNYRILGSGMAYSSHVFYLNSAVFYRRSNNYMAGGGSTVNFSQFEKINVMTNTGLHLSNNQFIEGGVIYDLATNVGYPALPMDVKSARGFISSLSYRKELPGIFHKWESKIYYNSVKHIMDDTKRPDVVMHMDMPGQSKTFGFYSTLPGTSEKHKYLLSFDSYYNQSLAEMTMYPANPEQKAMFMYTWPDIRTLNAGIYLEDKYLINSHHSIQVSSKLSLQRDGVRSHFGLNSLQIYYPNMQSFQNRVLWNVSANYLYYVSKITFKLGGGYGIRPPSPSEAYGYYLFNSFDRYDYLGNPGLVNESSWEGNFTVALNGKNSKLKIETTYFFFNNYIIGQPDKAYSSMTTNASGVKVYRNLPHATIFNFNLEFKQSFLTYFNWSDNLSYGYGRDYSNMPLPLIAPVSYTSALDFNIKQFHTGVAIQGAAKQYFFSADYGEDSTPAYCIVNSSMGYDFHYKKCPVNVKVGVENMLDKKYSTYSDWNNIPRKGRNVYFSIGINIE